MADCGSGYLDDYGSDKCFLGYFVYKYMSGKEKTNIFYIEHLAQKLGAFLL